MFKSHFTIAVRNFLQNKTFSFIHILGLSIGISASLMIYQIVRYETSFDKFEKDSERIYRIVMDMNFDGMEGHGPAVPAPLANAIQNEVTGVELTVPVMQFQGDATAKVTIASSSKSTPRVFKKQPKIVFTNDQYFSMLPFQWVAGDSKTSLSQPFAVVLTESRAKQYFPGVAMIDVVGRRIVYDDNLEVFVTGILRDLSEHSDFNAVEFISYPTIAKTNLKDNFMMDVWNDWMTYSRLYIKLEGGKSAVATSEQLAALMRKYNPTNGNGNRTQKFVLQPLDDIHFNTTYAGWGQRTADRNVLYGLLAIAAFLLLLGCINFTNLSTAQSTRRMKEICIRKTIGSSRKQLIVQFLGETFMITLIATLLSLGLIPLLIEFFADFTPPGLKFELFNDPFFVFFLPALVIIVSFFSGLYPAFVISRYRPVALLKNQADGSQTRSAFVRKSLTVSQFVIAQFFVIAALIVTKQVHYSLNQDMGFRREAILNFDTPHSGNDASDNQHRTEFYNRVSRIPGIQALSKGFLPPAMAGGAFGNVAFNDGKKEIKTGVQVRWGDVNYLKLYSIKLVAGRNINEGEQINEALVNESFIHEVGIQNPAEMIGQSVEMNGKKIPVVGVMKDFHQGSFHSFIGPIVFQASATGGYFHAALEPNVNGSWQETITKIQNTFTDIYPDHDFEYSFYDDTIAALYKKEQDTSSLLNWAMGLTILISCLGLLGLVMYTSLTRTKEIGIRKILGATVANLVTILSVDFVKPVLIAFVIAAPLAYWVMDKWLQTFAYQTTMSWWIFAAAGGILLTAAVITLSFQTIRTALDSPVKSLRNE